MHLFSWLPENISSFGREMDSLMWLIYYVVGVWFLIAEGLVFYFILRYRRKEGTRAAYATGRGFKAAAWVLVPALLVLICDFAIDARGSAPPGLSGTAATSGKASSRMARLSAK